jgi:hypothetical protein
VRLKYHRPVGGNLTEVLFELFLVHRIGSLSLRAVEPGRLGNSLAAGRLYQALCKEIKKRVAEADTTKPRPRMDTKQTAKRASGFVVAVCLSRGIVTQWQVRFTWRNFRTAGIEAVCSVRERTKRAKDISADRAGHTGSVLYGWPLGLTGEPEPVLLSVSNLRTHPAFLPTYLAPALAFPHVQAAFREWASFVLSRTITLNETLLSLVHQDVGDSRRASHSELATRCKTPGRQMLQLLPARWGSEQQPQFIFPLWEGFLRTHSSSWNRRVS